jgi:class 3 adenylate cyclase
MNRKTRMCLLVVALLTTQLKTEAAGGRDTLLSKSYSIQHNALSRYFHSLQQVYDSARFVNELNQLAEWAGEEKDLQLKCVVELQLFRFLARRGQVVKEHELVLQSLLQKAKDKKFKQLEAELLHTIGMFRWETLKDYTGALEYLIYAHNLYTGFFWKDFPQKADYVYEFGSRYYYFRDFNNAKKFFLECWNTIPEAQIDNRISKMNTLALCYRNLDLYDSAAYYFLKSRDWAIRNNDTTWIGIIGGNLGTVYEELKQYDKAIPLFLTDIELSLHKKEYGSAARAMASAALLHLNVNKKKEALSLADRSMALIYQQKLWQEPHTVRAAYPEIAKVYAEFGKSEKAFVLLDSAVAAKDSIEKSRSYLYNSGFQHKMDVEKHMAEMKMKESEISNEKTLRNGFLVGLGGLLVFSVILFVQKRRISKQRAISDNLLENILPAETAEELKRTGTAKAKNYDSVTVLFTDFKNFTAMSNRLSADQLVQEINYYYSSFDNIIAKYNLEKIKTIGDSYMCAGGLPVATRTHATDVIRAAMDMIRFMEQEKEHRQRIGKIFLEMRIGVNTGPVVAGIVGIKKFTYDIWGNTVNIASRMESAGYEGRINISESTYQQVKNDYKCIYRGEVEAKNNEMLKMYFVEFPLTELGVTFTEAASTTLNLPRK